MALLAKGVALVSSNSALHPSQCRQGYHFSPASRLLLVSDEKAIVPYQHSLTDCSHSALYPCPRIHHHPCPICIDSDPAEKAQRSIRHCTSEGAQSCQPQQAGDPQEGARIKSWRPRPRYRNRFPTLVRHRTRSGPDTYFKRHNTTHNRISRCRCSRSFSVTR
jgi:hypothetical protein